jgi:hypothetical protein
MTWEALAAIAQLAAVVGVVPSLIYLAAQIREQNKERRRGALGIATRGWATIFKTLTDSSEFADIYLRGVQQFDDLSPAERVRFSAFVGTALSNIEELYYYHKDGTLDAPHWGEVERTMTDIVAYPGTRLGGRRGDTGTQTNSPHLSIKSLARSVRQTRLIYS